MEFLSLSPSWQGRNLENKNISDFSLDFFLHRAMIIAYGVRIVHFVGMPMVGFRFLY
jgi:hypothetical protein